MRDHCKAADDYVLQPGRVAPATTPARSGPRISSGAIVASVHGVVEVECVIAELLPELQPLGDRERLGELSFLSLLFAVDNGPLGLVARSEQWSGAGGHVLNGTPVRGESGWRLPVEEVLVQAVGAEVAILLASPAPR